VYKTTHVLVCDRCGVKERLVRTEGHELEKPQSWADVRPPMVSPLGELPTYWEKTDNVCPNCLTESEKDALVVWVSPGIPF
jgi:hypothetical protein